MTLKNALLYMEESTGSTTAESSEAHYGGVDRNDAEEEGAPLRASLFSTW